MLVSLIRTQKGQRNRYFKKLKILVSYNKNLFTVVAIIPCKLWYTKRTSISIDLYIRHHWTIHFYTLDNFTLKSEPKKQLPGNHQTIFHTFQPSDWFDFNCIFCINHSAEHLHKWLNLSGKRNNNWIASIVIVPILHPTKRSRALCWCLCLYVYMCCV